jgi:hypothetical protein
MQFHRPWRAGFYTESASDAFLIQEFSLAGAHIQFEDAHRTDGDACAAVGASFLVAEDILTE